MDMWWAKNMGISRKKNMDVDMDMDTEWINPEFFLCWGHGRPPTSLDMACEITRAAQDDVVICCAVRTPLCKAKRGSFKDQIQRSPDPQVQGFLSYRDGMGWVFYHQFMATKKMGNWWFFFHRFFDEKWVPRFVWDQLERVILQTKILHQLQENTCAGQVETCFFLQ